MKLHCTRHAETRMQQRGISAQDLDLIVECGTVVRPGLYMLRSRDVHEEIREHKRRIQTLERLRGCAAVIEGGTVVTCYHVSGPAGRRAVRQDGKHRGRDSRS